MDDFVVSIGGLGAYDAFLQKVIVDGNSILAEILRLSDFIPPDFHDPSKSRFKQILIEFSYFSKIEQYERLFAQDENLQDLFYAKHGPLLQRFELLFQTIANFITSFNEYCESVANEKRIAIDATCELEAECLYTLGLILLYIDKYLPPTLRERIYVAIFRNSDERNNVEFLADFLKSSTSIDDSLFRRALKHPEFVSLVFKTLEYEGKDRSYQLERTNVDRAEMLFICLFFEPKVLHQDAAQMRRIVEAHFREKWVLSLGMGLIVNLLDEWTNYKAAYAAISGVIDTVRANKLANEHYMTLTDIKLPQGPILPAYFNSNAKLIVKYNASMKWLVLHTCDKCSRRGLQIRISMEVTSRYDRNALNVMLNVAKFEMDYIKAYRDALQNREETIKKFVDETAQIFGEIAAIFNQEIASLKVSKRTKLHDWFTLLKKTIEEMEKDSDKNVELIQQIKRRIAQVGEMLDLRNNYAIAQYLEKVNSLLDSLASVSMLSESAICAVEESSNAVYMWGLLDSWTPRIQNRLLKSSTSQPVRTLFYKLSLAITILERGLQDGETVRLISRAYSFYLERRLRAILQSIPQHLFRILHDTVKELANFEENFKLSEAAFTISNMSVGISRMTLKKLGTIEVNPRELLEAGIRRELAVELPKTLAVNPKWNNLSVALSSLTDNLLRLHEGFIYMCDHMDVNGHETWREETQNLLEQLVDERLERDNNSKKTATNFFDAIVDLLYKNTNPNTCRYMANELEWKDAKTKAQMLTPLELNAIENLLPCYLISSIDKILATDLESTCFATLRDFRSVMSSIGQAYVNQELFNSPTWEAINKTMQAQQQIFTASIAKIGQITLLRREMAFSKRISCRRTCETLFLSLKAYNKQLVSNPSELPEDAPNLAELFKQCGLFSPELQILDAQTSIASVKITLPLFSLLITNLSKFEGTKKDSVCEVSFLVGALFCLKQTNEVADFSIALELHQSSQAMLPKKYQIDMQKTLQKIDIIFS
ncbi:hypothetical protein WR25_06791 [Diploscapter pachys]|uniref:WASH complex subunit strumpellin n=1 Tax=Diploscapter pachys TaxID=2018661 RepID=A0A2A2KY72_9BILA|nr:hypothetical protein WR25_06791 [Diploscapter pachys]